MTGSQVARHADPAAGEHAIYLNGTQSRPSPVARQQTSRDPAPPSQELLAFVRALARWAARVDFEKNLDGPGLDKLSTAFRP
jgi:hypothetical protein